MPRIRSIKPEFWTDPMMVSLPAITRLFYIALWNYADDQGCFWDEPERLEMELMPKEPGFDAEYELAVLEGHGRLVRGRIDGKIFWKIAHWEEHQKIDHPSKPRILRESSRKLAIPQESRRRLASKYGCPPGERHEAKCYLCDSPGQIIWHKLGSGKPSSWVTFSGLEIDHFEPEAAGGSNGSGNLILTCRHCNRSRRDGEIFSYISEEFGVVLESSRGLAPDREGEKEGNKEGRGKGVQRETSLQPPTIEEVRVYALETFNLNSTFAQDFMTANEAKGWKDAKGKPYKNWKLLVGTWVKHLKPDEVAKYKHNPPPDNSMVKR